MAYSDSVNKTKSQKRVLAHIEPTQKLVLWTLDSGSTYYRDVSFYTVGLENNEVALTEASSSTLSSGEFYFDAESLRLYCRLSDDSNPQDSDNYMVATYRLFFSNEPIVLPHDMTETGTLVEYDALIDATSSFPQEIDNTDQIGIALESNGSISLKNTHGYFDGIFDKLFFENKAITIYSYLDLRPVTENRILFSGKIENKAFSTDKITFRLKDFVHELREEVPLAFFNNSDGVLSDSVLGNPKRLLYGRVDGVKAIATDAVLAGYPLTGSVVAQRSTTATVTGTGTLFSSELVAGNLVEINSREYTVQSIASDTSMVITSGDPIDSPATLATIEKVTLASLSGNVTAIAPTLTVEGTGTNFTGELTASDTFRVGSTDYDIDSITDADTLVVSSTITSSFAGQPYSKVTKATLTGTVSFDAEGRYLTGSGTSFISELSIDDEIVIPSTTDEVVYAIEEVRTDTLAVIAELPTAAFSGSINVRPAVSYRGKNRNWHIAGHKLREPTTTITAALQLNRFNADTSDFFEGDAITVGSERVFIKRLSSEDNLFILNQNLSALPIIGTTVTKSPISKVYFNKKEFLIDRDYSITNTASDCTLSFNDLAEFNVSREQSLRGVITFSNGLTTVSGAGSFFNTDLKPRDWIRSIDINHTSWYEVLEIIDDSTLKIRTSYAGSSVTAQGKKKNVEYLNDDSVVTVDCIGKENASGAWVRTASDVVKDLLDLAGITNIDSSTFSVATDEATHTISLKVPLDPLSSRPKIKDVVTLVNKSVFGSLYVKSDWSLAYSILSSEKPTSLEIIEDQDINTWKVSTKTDVVRRVYAKYRHFDADRFTGDEGSKVQEYENDFIDKLIGSKNSLNKDIYLYDDRAAETITQRYALLNSLTQSIVTIQTKLNLTLKNINDKIYINLNRLYSRFGASANNSKIGIISKISRKGDSTEVGFSDLGNIFNRVANITDSNANDFTAASDNEKILNGYIVDNDTELPDSSPTSDDEWNTNLIG